MISMRDNLEAVRVPLLDA